MKSQSCKSKGRRLQSAIVRRILDHFAELEQDDVRSCSMGANGEDVQLSPRARGLLPFSIEAKNVEKLNVWGALEQAERNAGGFDPLLVFKRNHSKTYATVELDVFLRLVVAARAGQRAAGREGTGDAAALCEALADARRAVEVALRAAGCGDGARAPREDVATASDIADEA